MEKFGMPASTIVGTSGAGLVRVRVIAAMARSLPSFTCGNTRLVPPIRMFARPAIMSGTAAASPL